jgi:hypothetical protein
MAPGNLPAMVINAGVGGLADKAIDSSYNSESGPSPAPFKASSAGSPEDYSTPNTTNTIVPPPPADGPPEDRSAGGAGPLPPPTGEDDSDSGSLVSFGDMMSTASDWGNPVYDEDADDPNYDPIIGGAPLTAEEKDEAINAWFKADALYDSDDEEAIASLPRPQDHSLSYQHLETKEITDPKAVQNPAILAPYYGFPGPQPFEDWIAQDLIINEVMAPLLKFCNEKRATLGPKEQMKKVTLDQAMASIKQNENKSRKNFTLNRAAVEQSWSDEEHHGCALYNLMFRLCELETGRFTYSNWKDSVKWNRCWFLLRRVKRRDEKAREKPAAKQALLKRWVHEGLKKDGPTFGEKLMQMKESIGRKQSKARKVVQKEERRRAAAAAVSGVLKEKRSKKNDKKKGANATDMNEDDLDEIAFAKAKEQLLKAQFAALNDKLVTKTLEKLQKQQPGKPRMTKDELAALEKAIVNPDMFDVEDLEAHMLNNTLSIHLPQLKEGTQFQQRLSEEAANKHFEKLLRQSREAVENNTANPNPGLIESMKAVMLVLHPQEYEKHIFNSADITAREIEDIHFSVEDAASAEAIELIAQGEKIALGLRDVEDKKKKAGKAKPHFDHSEIKSIVALLSNTKWESSNFLEACKRLRVNPGSPIRLPGMREGGPHLYWFQVAAIHGMMEKLDEGIVDGVILAAVVGLGKTITMLSYILVVSSLSFPWAMFPSLPPTTPLQSSILPWVTHRSLPRTALSNLQYLPGRCVGDSAA